MVGVADRTRRPGRAAIDAAAASWTIASNSDGCALTGTARRVSRFDLRPARLCGPACAGRASPRLSPALTPGQRRRRRRLEYARHGRSLGGESPLEEEVMLTPSRRQLRRREAGWEGSPRRIPAPRNTNRVGGGAIWVSLLKKVKPVITDKVVT
jgi:hypothetical protein